MSKQTIDAKTRTTTGKTAAKNLRKEGRIPAVVYNAKGEATSIDVDEVEFNKIWRTITPTTSIVLNIDGKAIDPSAFSRILIENSDYIYDFATIEASFDLTI